MAGPTIEFEIKGDITNLKKAGSEAKMYARDTKKELDKSLVLSMELNIAKFQSKLDEARKELREAKKDGDKETELNLRLKTNELSRNLTEAKRQLNNYLNTGQTGLSRLQSKFDKVTGAIKNQVLGLGTALAGTFAIDRIIKFGAESFEAFRNFEKGLANINTVARVTEKELAGLGDEIQKISKQYGIAKDELLQTSFNIASAGVEFKNITSLLALSSQVALASATDTTTAFNGIIAVVKKYGLDLQDATKIADFFFKTNELGQTTVNDLSLAMTKLSATAPLAGISLEELFGIYSTLTGVTGDANAVTTQLNGAINAIAAPTKEASAKFKELGIEVGASAIKQKGFAEVSREIYEATGGNLEVLRKLIPEVEASKLVVALATTQYDKFNTSVQSLTDSQGSLGLALEKITKTTDFKLRVQQQRWDNFKIKVGGVIKDIGGFLFDLGDIVNSIFNIWGALIINGTLVFLGFGNSIGNAIKDIINYFEEFADVVPKIFKQVLNNLPILFKQAFNSIIKTLRGSKIGEKIANALGLNEFAVGTLDTSVIELPKIDNKNFRESIDSTIGLMGNMQGEIEKNLKNIKDVFTGTKVRTQVLDKIIIDSQKFGSELKKEFENTGNNSDILTKSIEDNNKKILDSSIKRLEEEAKVNVEFIKKSELSEEEKANEIIKINEKLSDDILRLKGEQLKIDEKNAKETIKNAEEQEEKRKKAVEGFYDEIDDRIKKSENVIEDYQEQINKTNEEFKKLKDEATKSIEEINEDLESLGAQKDVDLAERRVKLLEEQAKLQKELADTVFIADDNDRLKAREELNQKILDIKKEVAFIDKNASQGAIEEAERQSGLTDSQKIVEDFEKEKAVLEERKRINEQILAGEQINLDEIKDRKNRDLAEDLINKQAQIDSELEIARQGLESEKEAIIDLFNEKRKIEQEYTEFFKGEIQKRIDEIRKLAQEWKSATGDIATQQSGQVVNNNINNTNIGGVTNNSNVDLDSFFRRLNP